MNAPAAAAAELPSLGGSIAVSFLSLGLVCLLAYAALKLLARRGVGRGSGPLRVVARCPLEPRRSLYIVEAAGRCFLVGVGDGPMALLAEVDAAKVEAAVEAAERQRPAIPFAETLARVMARGKRQE